MTKLKKQIEKMLKNAKHYKNNSKNITLNNNQ